MFELSRLLPVFLLILPLLLLLFITKVFTQQSTDTKFPKSYPLIGHLIAFYQHKNDRFQWIVNLVINSPSNTFIIHRPFGNKSITTGDPANVEHILKTHFPIYQKGSFQKSILEDLLGDGIFNVDGETWKFQRQVSIHEFNTKSARKFVERVVDAEISDKLIPILQDAARKQAVLDLQDILQRFAFDNICTIAFGCDPEYLSPSLPEKKFAVAFEDAVMISTQRFRAMFPILWKICKFLNIGSDKKLKQAILEIREFAEFIIRQKKQEMMMSTLETEDLLSKFLKSGHSDTKFVADIVISFILAGRDTTSSALTWFFWLLHKNKQVEEEIMRERSKIKEKNNNAEQSSAFNEVKDMVYTQAALCESMRLYPPVPADLKEAITDDVLPDGTPIKKGMLVTYHTYAMGRLERLWGSDWAKYRPERWLEVDNRQEMEESKWKFVAHDPYSFPVFQAGPRICLGKEMAFMQMKKVVAGILERFQVIPVVEEGFEPVYLPHLTAKMQGGFPVRFQERKQTE